MGSIPYEYVNCLSKKNEQLFYRQCVESFLFHSISSGIEGNHFMVQIIFHIFNVNTSFKIFK